MFEKIGSRLTVFEDDTGFIAADDQGRQYDYAHEGFPEVSPDVPARIWLKNKGGYHCCYSETGNPLSQDALWKVKWTENGRNGG